MPLFNDLLDMKKRFLKESDIDLRAKLLAVVKGIYNYRNNKNTEIAIERYNEFCKGCEFLETETNEFLIVKDVYELHAKKCNDCGCVLSYKNRQSISKCKKWK
jgi:hypothetical protein